MFFLPVIINKCYLQINKCYHLTAAKLELTNKNRRYDVGVYAPIITELCITIILRSGFFYFTALGGPCLWYTPRLELKGKTKQKNTELRGRFYGRFSNKLEISCWLRLASSACSGLDHGDPAAIRFRSQACNSAFNILEHTQTASPLTMPYCTLVI